MEQLDKGFAVFFSSQTILFCLGVFMVTFAIRRVVETGWVGAKTNKWWTEVFLPLGPIATGVILAFAAKTYTWPDVIKDPWSRAFYGGACGMASGWVYTRFRAILKAWVTTHGQGVGKAEGEVEGKAEGKAEALAEVSTALSDANPPSLGPVDLVVVHVTAPAPDAPVSDADKTPSSP